MQKVLFIFTLLLAPACGSKKETTHYNSRLRQVTAQKEEVVTVGHKTAHSALAYSETTIRLLPPDSAGVQAIESVTRSRMDFARQDSIATRTEKAQEATGDTRTEEELRQDESRTGGGTSRLPAIVIAVAVTGLFVLALRGGSKAD